MCLVLFSLVAAAFLANKDVYIKCNQHYIQLSITIAKKHENIALKTVTIGKMCMIYCAVLYDSYRSKLYLSCLVIIS